MLSDANLSIITIDSTTNDSIQNLSTSDTISIDSNTSGQFESLLAVSNIEEIASPRGLYILIAMAIHTKYFFFKSYDLCSNILTKDIKYKKIIHDLYSYTIELNTNANFNFRHVYVNGISA